MEKSILVVDILGLYSLATIFFKFRACRSVFYLNRERNIFIRMVIRVLSSYGWSFKQLDYTLAPLDGISPYKKLAELLIERIKICREEIFFKEMDRLSGVSLYERKRMSACLAKYAGAEMFFMLELYVLLTTKFPLKDRIKAVLLKRTPFWHIIKQVYKDGDLATFFYISACSGKALPREDCNRDERILKLAKFCSIDIRGIIKTSLLVPYSLLCKPIYFFLRPFRLFKKHKICALKLSHYASEKINHIQWSSEEAGYLKNQILLLHLVSLPKVTRKFYARRADELLAYSYIPFLGDSDIRLIASWSYFVNLLIKNLWRYRKLFGLNGIKRWVSKYLLDLLTQISFFESFFRVNGIKILWNSEHNSPQPQMAAIAINRIGGVSLGYTWSQSALPEWQAQLNQYDVYCVWGQRLANIHKSTYDQCNSFIATGYPADKLFASEFERAQNLRTSLFNQYSARRVFAFVDDVVARDEFVSKEAFFSLLKEIFVWLKEDTENFLIIKAKYSGTIIKYPDIKRELDGFCKNKKLLIFHEKATLYPLLAADAIISPYLTLPVLAAILGWPFIFYDIHGIIQKYPLDISNLRVISKQIQIKPTMDNVINERARIGYPKELRPIRDTTIDPFVDGKSGERIREYLENLFKKFGEGFSNAEAVNYANEQHKIRWGKDTITLGSLGF